MPYGHLFMCWMDLFRTREIKYVDKFLLGLTDEKCVILNDLNLEMHQTNK